MTQIDKHGSFFQGVSAASRRIPGPRERCDLVKFGDPLASSWDAMTLRLLDSTTIIVTDAPVHSEFQFDLSSVSRICQSDIMEVVGKSSFELTLRHMLIVFTKTTVRSARWRE